MMKIRKEIKTEIKKVNETGTVLNPFKGGKSVIFKVIKLALLPVTIPVKVVDGFIDSKIIQNTTDNLKKDEETA